MGAAGVVTGATGAAGVAGAAAAGVAGVAGVADLEENVRATLSVVFREKRFFIILSMAILAM